MTPAVVAVPRGAVHILLVEDRASDALFVLREFGRQHPHVVVEVCESGLDALRRLHEHPPTAAVSLVVLDLRLPGMDGLDVLARMRLEPRLRDIPVAVLTGSRREEDVVAAYDLGAVCYLCKPELATGYGQIVEQLGKLCASVAKTTVVAAPAVAPADF